MPDFLPDYDTGDRLSSPVLDYLVGMPLIIQIALAFSVVSVIFIFVIQLRILFTRYKGNLRQKRLDRIVPEIDGLISEYIILRGNLFNEGTSSEHVPVDTDAFRGAMFYSRKNKQILIDRLINYRKSFGGNIGSMLRTVYLDQGLDKLSFKKMKSFRWNTKIKGIRELTDMDISISDVNILPLTNSKRHELRAEAAMLISN